MSIRPPFLVQTPACIFLGNCTDVGTRIPWFLVNSCLTRASLYQDVILADVGSKAGLTQ